MYYYLNSIPSNTLFAQKYLIDFVHFVHVLCIHVVNLIYLSKKCNLAF